MCGYISFIKIRIEASAESNFVVANIDAKKYESKRTPQYVSVWFLKKIQYKTIGDWKNNYL